MKKSRPVLKSYFETGDKPTEQEFSDLIDSLVHIDDGTVITNVAVDEFGNQTISLSNGTTISISKPQNNSEQNNKIRVVDLGRIRSGRGGNVDAQVIRLLNSMDPPLMIAEDEIVVFEYDYQEITES